MVAVIFAGRPSIFDGRPHAGTSPSPAPRRLARGLPAQRHRRRRRAHLRAIGQAVDARPSHGAAVRPAARLDRDGRGGPARRSGRAGTGAQRMHRRRFRAAAALVPPASGAAERRRRASQELAGPPARRGRRQGARRAAEHGGGRPRRALNAGPAAAGVSRRPRADRRLAARAVHRGAGKRPPAPRIEDAARGGRGGQPLTTRPAGPVRHQRFHRRRGDGAATGDEAGGAGCAGRRAGADPRRNRLGQGGGGARDPCPVASRRWPFPARELRRDPAGAGGLGAVRPRARQLHRRGGNAQGLVRARRRRHLVPRRMRRIAVGGPGAALADPAGRLVRPGRRRAPIARGRADRRRDASRPAGHGGDRHVPRRPVVSPVGLSGAAAAAA